MYVNKCLIKPIRNTKKSEIPSISVPFPPELTVEEILRRRPDAKLGSRAPNRFFIYRLAYIKELRKRVDDTVSMTKISPHIGLSWAKESTSVKEAYKKLSDKVEERLKEIRQNETLVLISENFPPQQPRSPQHPLSPQHSSSPQQLSSQQQHQRSSSELSENNIVAEENYNLINCLYPSSPPYDQYPIDQIEDVLQMDPTPSFDASIFYQDMVNYEHHHWPYYYESNAPCFWLVEDNSILVDFNNTIESILNQQFDY
ncbi:hypothetical protein RirG_193230 [Rhizophagus irregularis DAOM 197198w]|uniref:MATA-HMG n=1 Tax=Rhizophagus irregularis (strain DAOM 197198w) TaxID=1432141 RepID=A0A015IX66_RHIIW|nr:hypothetical protein RirG_193230 [Rhizophagus irregularis DAOM 197198w]